MQSMFSFASSWCSLVFPFPFQVCVCSLLNQCLISMAAPFLLLSFSFGLALFVCLFQRAASSFVKRTKKMRGKAQRFFKSLFLPFHVFLLFPRPFRIVEGAQVIWTEGHSLSCRVLGSFPWATRCNFSAAQGAKLQADLPKGTFFSYFSVVVSICWLPFLTFLAWRLFPRFAIQQEPQL